MSNRTEDDETPAGGLAQDQNLTLESLHTLAADRRPAVDPRDLAPRMVHFGFGAFHRAHQAVYTEAAAAATGEKSGIVVVAPRDAAVVGRARRQDYLFSVTTRSPAGSAPKVVGSLVGALHMPTDGAALHELIASPGVTTVTLTVTEKGYHRSPSTGRLNLGDPLIAADLDLCRAGAAGTSGTGSGDVPPLRTVVGTLAVALARRLRTGGAPIDLVSCDNLDANGPALAGVVRDFVTAAHWPDGDRLLDWIDTGVGFPSTVVDRIVPATTGADLDQAAARLGVHDALAVTGEPYRQWVLEDAFRAARPAWQHGGAQWVDDVGPFQLTKLRLLNGSHSGLAYLGLAAGCRTVADVLATGWGENFVRGFAAEAAGSLPHVRNGTPQAGPDPARYADDLVSRFANTAIHHELRQIGSDGSLKLPQRWIQVLREQGAGSSSSMVGQQVGQRMGYHQTLALAAWANATRPDPATGGQLFATTDPAAAALAACWQGPPAGVIGRLLAVLGAPDLAEDTSLTQAVESLLPAFAAGSVPL
ncbi:mannitol dehydrogenase family protein [Kineosporia sp. J2-2]|uniref:Mannitol-1-phosphate 5-dehydrogenase n=1 Tax=Kineosporia corallincola TaxID=2835133 RepID=A0ABS5TDJ1_9ACTN|nr:mannitol dehydrogenase family protein [Kineosporia corallincola]MBT0768266.1 mannitol dehydrogenase family protein [Kineosporia corallincola]